MKYDYKTLYEKNAAFLTKRKGGVKAVVVTNTILSYFFPAAYLLLWAYGFFGEFTPIDFLKLFFLPASVLLLTIFVKLGANRPRPFDEKGAGVTPLKEKLSRPSFPSVPLALATTLTLLFFPYIPAVGGLCGLLAAAYAYCLFALGWHYPSDILGSFLFGGAVGCLVFFL